MDQLITNQFRAALTHLLAQEGRGSQARLAKQQNIDRGYLNAIVKGRKSGSEKIRSKIASHFDMAYELERTMADRGKDTSCLNDTRLTPGNSVFVRQQEPLGLGHAIWCARDIIGDEPFAIFLPDEFMVGSPSCMKQMVAAYEKLGGNIVCALEIPIEDTPSYGVIDPGYRDGPITEVKGLVEKPAAGTAPSNLILPGRYILQPEVMRILETQEAGAGGEIQLTDAMAQMIGKQPFHGMTFDGQRYDCGSKTGYVAANLALALAHSEIGGDIRAITEKLLEKPQG